MSKKVILGKKIPTFKAISSSGAEFSLASHKGQKVVLYFYPKDSTPGCTTEGVEFSKLLPQFKKLNTVVVGVSRDSLKAHDKFICKYDLKIELLADEDSQVCDLFEVIKEKQLYGKKFMGIERSTFVIDESQKLIGEFRKVKAAGHASEVLQFLKDFP